MFRRLRQLGVTILLCVAAAEVAGALYLYWLKGQIVYVPRATTDAPPVNLAQVSARLHPYFGFTGDRAYPVGIPFSPQPGELVVALFGGSVAARLESPPMGGVPLFAVLQALTDRKIVLLNMAEASGKQPQNLF